MSRSKARGKIDYKTKQVIAPGLVSREVMMEWIGKLGVELRGAGTDESPQAYKRLPEVLAFHETTIRVLHTLMPIGVAMADENEHDPFKD
jgi:tRNA-splicing ligase RtcB